MHRALKRILEIQQKLVNNRKLLMLDTVSLDPSLMSEDKEMLEDLLAAAVNDAVRRVESSQKDMMKGMTDGFPFPPGFKP